MTLQTQRVQTLEQVRAFVEGSEAVDVAGDDRAGVYALVRRTLVKLCVWPTTLSTRLLIEAIVSW